MQTVDCLFFNRRLGWRWAFLIQLPLFGVSSLLTTSSLNYVTPGEGGNPWEALKGVDYAGCGYLLIAVWILSSEYRVQGLTEMQIGSFLGFLSLHFNDDIPVSSKYHPIVGAKC